MYNLIIVAEAKPSKSTKSNQMGCFLLVCSLYWAFPVRTVTVTRFKLPLLLSSTNGDMAVYESRRKTSQLDLVFFPSLLTFFFFFLLIRHVKNVAWHVSAASSSECHLRKWLVTDHQVGFHHSTECLSSNTLSSKQCNMKKRTVSSRLLDVSAAP